MRLACLNLRHAAGRFLVTAAGVAGAVFLMTLQGSILVGFLRAGSKLIDAAGSDLWITARGIPCFEFPAPLESRLADIAHSVRGVASTARICVRTAQFKRRDGNQQLVTIVGAEDGVDKSFPVPGAQDAPDSTYPEAVLIDRSSVEALDVSTLPADVEINGRRARVVGEASGFSTFLGTPYVFSSYRNAARHLGLDAEQTMYILARVDPPADIESVKRALQARLSNVDVWTRDEFARRSRLYWLTQTGAGGAILTAALLAFVIGLAIVSQALFASTMEHLEEFATLRALGASKAFIVRTILFQSLICGVAGYGTAVLAAMGLLQPLQEAIPWIYTPWWLPMLMFVPTCVMCGLASVLSVRAALTVDPARVFRA